MLGSMPKYIFKKTQTHKYSGRTLKEFDPIKYKKWAEYPPTSWKEKNRQASTWSLNCIAAASQPALYIFAFRKRRIKNRTCICAWYNFMGPSKTSFLSFYNRNIQTKNITEFVSKKEQISGKMSAKQFLIANRSRPLSPNGKITVVYLVIHSTRVVCLSFCFDRTASVWILPLFVNSTIARWWWRRNMRTRVGACANMADNLTGWRWTWSGAWSFANVVSTIKYSRLWDVYARSTAHL